MEVDEEEGRIQEEVGVPEGREGLLRERAEPFFWERQVGSVFDDLFFRWTVSCMRAGHCLTLCPQS